MSPARSDNYDIFISYAHVDDEPLPGESSGWVTTLVAYLKILLARKLGRKEHFSLWMDHQLAGNVPVTPQILSALQKSATIVIILSPGYLASLWCRLEMNSFLQAVKQRVDTGSRVFVVENDRVDQRPLNWRK
jgi:hypothetical protein